jgi:hypothetical protein
MKTPTILALLAVVLSGLALLTSLLRAPDATPPSDAAPISSIDADRAALLERLEQLAARVELLSLQPTPEPVQPLGDVYATRAELDTLREELQAGLAALARDGLANPDALAGSAAFQEQVATTLEALRKEEAVDGVKAKQERRAAELAASMPAYQEWLGMTDQQTDQLQSALERRHAREAALLQLWEDGVDDQLLGEHKRNDQITWQSELQGFLSEEQIETLNTKG